MFVNDRTHTDTFGCRLSLKLYRGEADSVEGTTLDNLMDKGVLSVREEAGFISNSNIDNTHNSRKGRI